MKSRFLHVTVLVWAVSLGAVTVKGETLFLEDFELNTVEPRYPTQRVDFTDPNADFVFIKNVADVNSWAGEDYGVVKSVGINDNADSAGLGVPSEGFHGDQGAVLVYDVTDESGNGAFCALSAAFPRNMGGPGGSGLPMFLNDTILHVGIDFNVPADPCIVTLNEALSLWIVEQDGDEFEHDDGIIDLTKGWRTYSFELNDMANHPVGPGSDGVFGDSPVVLLAVQFEDPNVPQEIETILYFVDDFRIVSAPPRIIYVDADAPGNADGSNWANAHNYLQDALAEANSVGGAVEIRVAEGVYTPDSNSADPTGSGDRTATFQLVSGVAVRGGFAGFGEPDPNARNTRLYETILSGDLDGNDVDVSDPCDLLNEPTRSENSYHVFYHPTGTNLDSAAVLDGFIITGGNANGPADPAWHNTGGGMYNEDSNPTVSGCTFRANAAVCAGGMFNWNSSPTVINCTFRGNAGYVGGGGMCNFVSDTVVANCSFSANSTGDYGGGMSNWNCRPTVTNCTFAGNSAEGGGGMLNYDYSSPTVTRCAFSGNAAANWGAGMYNDHYSSPTVTNCTFSGNAASDSGGGMFNTWFSSPTLTNNILSGNTASGGPQIYDDGTGSATVTYCDVQGGWPGLGNIDADPFFAKPGRWVDANDPNIVVEPDDPNAVWIDGDYHLRSEGWRWDVGGRRWVRDAVTSRCIDAGNPGSPLRAEFVTVPPDPNNTRGQNLRINIGAYGGTREASMAPYYWALLSDITNDGGVDFSDFAYLADIFAEREKQLPADFDRDGDADYADVALLADDWLWRTTWYEP